MSCQYLLDSHTSARRVFAIVLGAVEVGLGLVRIRQGIEQRCLIIILDGLTAIVYGAKSLLSGWGADGETWLDLGKEARRLVCLYVRIQGLRHLLNVLLESMEHWGQDWERCRVSSFYRHFCLFLILTYLDSTSFYSSYIGRRKTLFLLQVLEDSGGSLKSVGGWASSFVSYKAGIISRRECILLSSMIINCNNLSHLSHSARQYRSARIWVWNLRLALGLCATVMYGSFIQDHSIIHLAFLLQFSINSCKLSWNQ